MPGRRPEDLRRPEPRPEPVQSYTDWKPDWLDDPELATPLEGMAVATGDRRRIEADGAPGPRGRALVAAGFASLARWQAAPSRRWNSMNDHRPSKARPGRSSL